MSNPEGTYGNASSSLQASSLKSVTSLLRNLNETLDMAHENNMDRLELDDILEDATHKEKKRT